MSTPSSLAQGSTFLVTGVNGYIGSHVADQLLLAGYKVRGTARDDAKTKWAQELFDGKYGPGKFEAVVVPDMTAESAYDEALKGVDGIAHVAANLSFSPDPHVVITDTVNGALNVLRTASKQPSVKSVVITSSSSAVATNYEAAVELTEEMWNDAAVKLAWEGKLSGLEQGLVVYAASKTESEKACWKFMRDEKPSFQFNTVVPNFNFGPVLEKGQRGSSSALIGLIVNGQSHQVPVSLFPNEFFVDVRDVARLHVAALIYTDVKSECLFAFAAAFNWTQIYTILRKAYPNRQIPDDIPDEPMALATIHPRSYQRGVELFKRFGREGFTGLEECVKANAESYL